MLLSANREFWAWLQNFKKMLCAYERVCSYPALPCAPRPATQASASSQLWFPPGCVRVAWEEVASVASVYEQTPATGRPWITCRLLQNKHSFNAFIQCLEQQWQQYAHQQQMGGPSAFCAYYHIYIHKQSRTVKGYHNILPDSFFLQGWVEVLTWWIPGWLHGHSSSTWVGCLHSP